MTMAFDGRIAISGLVPLTPTKIVKPENFSPPEIVAEPSQADETLTRTLKQALALVDVRVLDHFIVGGGDALSFAERGLL